jgi:hypothetical protein
VDKDHASFFRKAIGAEETLLFPCVRFLIFSIYLTWEVSYAIFVFTGILGHYRYNISNVADNFS